KLWRRTDDKAMKRRQPENVRSPAVDLRHRQFRLGELAKILDVDARRVKGWVEQGFIRPTGPGQGPGQPRRFDITQLAQATLLLARQAAFGQKSPVPPQLVLQSAAGQQSPVPSRLRWLRLDLVGLLQGDSPQAWDPNWKDGDEVFYVVSYDAAR